jgi:hypothetical protein
MNIYESMAAVMEDCGTVAKSSTNEKQRYKYRGIDAVMNALNPALRKHKVFVVPEVQDQEREKRTTQNGGVLIYSTVKVKYTFYAEDGTSVTAVVIGEGMDSGDKSTNKAMSAAFKYACFQAFCIPTEEMRDSEEDSPEPAPRTMQRPSQHRMSRPSPEQAEVPATPETPAQKAAVAYPDRNTMVEAILKASKPEALENWLKRVGVDSVAKAPDPAIMALYNYYAQRGMA